MENQVGILDQDSVKRYFTLYYERIGDYNTICNPAIVSIELKKAMRCDSIVTFLDQLASIMTPRRKPFDRPSDPWDDKILNKNLVSSNMISKLNMNQKGEKLGSQLSQHIKSKI